MNNLTKKLLKTAQKNGLGATLKDSEFAKIDYYINSNSVVLNLLLSAKWNGGVPAGKISMLAGPKSHGKSQVAYQITKNFINDFDGTILLFDSEFASQAEALEKLGIDTEKVLYFPLSRINDDDKEISLTYQFKRIMNEIERGDKVLAVFDSMGAWLTSRTMANAEKGNTAKDMSIASEKKGFMALISELIGMRGVPCLVLNHSYANVGGFGSQSEVAGGGALYYPSSIVEITSKAKLKINDEDVGMIGTAKVYKGRLAREKAVAKFAIHYEYGFLPYFGLDELAMAGGYIEEEKEGRNVIYKITGQENGPTVPKKTYMLPEGNKFWEEVLKTTDFGLFLNDLFSYGSNKKLKSLKIEAEEKDNNKSKKE